MTNNENYGVAGNAENYGAKIKSQVINNQDVLLISKYRTDYENVVLDLDDLINTLMLEKALSVDISKPMDSLKELVTLNEAKLALNNVMKYVDKN